MEKIKDKREPKFTKQQLLLHPAFMGVRDILQVVLKDDSEYSIEQATNLVQKFMKVRA